jgi:hypothetical protein
MFVVCAAPKDFYIIWLSYLLIMSIPDSRNASCLLTLISTFIFILDLCRLLLEVETSIIRHALATTIFIGCLADLFRFLDTEAHGFVAVK